MPASKPITPAVIANGPIVPPPMTGAYCQIRFDQTPVSAPASGPASTPTRIVPIESM